MSFEEKSVEEVQGLLNAWLYNGEPGVASDLDVFRFTSAVMPIWPEVVTTEFIDDFIRYIYHIRWDAEAAHIFEDELHAGVLAAIADDRCLSPKECALRALRSHRVPFKRRFS